MAIVFNCPNCGRDISAPDAGAGKRGKCPGCGDPIMVPAADTPPEEGAPNRDTVQGGGSVSSALDQFQSQAGREEPYEAEEVHDEYEVEAPRSRRRSASRDDDDDEMYDDEKQCPSCGELIRSSARRCRYCGEDFGGGRRRRRGRIRENSNSTAQTLGTLSIVAGALALVFSFCCGFLALPFGVTGLVLGIIGKDSGAPAIVGIVLSVLSFLLMVGVFFLGFAMQANPGGF